MPGKVVAPARFANATARLQVVANLLCLSMYAALIHTRICYSQVFLVHKMATLICVPLGKVFTAYRQKTGTPNTSRFLLEGSVLDDLHTCSFYGMEDGDMVDVMPQQQGD